MLIYLIQCKICKKTYPKHHITWWKCKPICIGCRTTKFNRENQY
jgi:hypothetical protein